MNPKAPSAIAPELAACPLCNGLIAVRPAPVIEDLTNDDGYWRIYCEASEHYVEATGDTREKAIERWNRRAPDPQATAREAVLREALTLVDVGGNHLANVLVEKLGGDFATRWPPDTEPDDALRSICATPWFDVWCCWRTIMLSRTAIESTSEQAGKMLAVVEAAQLWRDERSKDPISWDGLSKAEANLVSASRALTLTTKEPGDG